MGMEPRGDDTPQTDSKDRAGPTARDHRGRCPECPASDRDRPKPGRKPDRRQATGDRRSLRPPDTPPTRRSTTASDRQRDSAQDHGVTIDTCPAPRLGAVARVATLRACTISEHGDHACARAHTRGCDLIENGRFEIAIRAVDLSDFQTLDSRRRDVRAKTNVLRISSVMVEWCADGSERAGKLHRAGGDCPEVRAVRTGCGCHIA